jgi:flagellar hook-length control protein FliK
LVGLLKATDSTSSVTVRLQPTDLGQVRIRIGQTAEGAAHIDITAERPETLQLLQRDEPRLQQALDQAGVLSTGRTVSFQVAAPEQVGATASRPDSMATGSDGSGQGQSGGPWRQNDDTQRDSGGGSDSDQGQARARWFRVGLDITA